MPIDVSRVRSSIFSVLRDGVVVNGWRQTGPSFETTARRRIHLAKTAAEIGPGQTSDGKWRMAVL